MPNGRAVLERSGCAPERRGCRCGRALAGYLPLTADANRLDDYLGQNVEVHLLACRRGIAVLEEQYKPELNPSVALERGWLRAIGRDVLCLQEGAFRHQRADRVGLVVETFSWPAPEVRISTAVSRWLRPEGRP